MARTPRLRYLRHRRLGRFLHQPDVTAFLAERATTLGGTGATQTVSAVSTGADTITVTGHGFNDGEGPFQVTSTGTVPGGLSATGIYYVAVVDANTLQLHGSPLGALGGKVIDLTSAGSGTISIARADDTSADMHAWMTARGVKAETLSAATDVDSL